MAGKKTARFEPTEFIPKGQRYKEQYGVVVICEDEPHQQQINEDLHRRGLRCKVVVT